MTDVESHQWAQSQPTVTNPYSSSPPVLPPLHPYNIVKRSSIIGLCLYGLHTFKVYHNVLHSPAIRHEWFKIGLASCVAILGVKAYVEMYAGRWKNQKVNYENFRSSTHAVIFLILLASFSFHVSLWPVYGAKTLLIMFMIGFGVLLQLTLLLPTYLQNIAGAALMTFFIQEYA